MAAKPLPLIEDGDLVALVQYMIRTRGRHTVRVTKVTGHATDVDVDQGRVRIEDNLGLLIDAGRRLLKVRSHSTSQVYDCGC